MLVLGIDTATPYLVLGLPNAGHSIRLERRHAEVLWSELEAFLRLHGVERGQLEGIAVGQGPGSYTGLRVGISAGLGLARGLGIPVVGVNTLHATALRYNQPVTVAQTTRNGLCYAASYSGMEQLEPPTRTPLADLDPSHLFSLDEPPSGQALVRLGQMAIGSGRLGIDPMYL